MYFKKPLDICRRYLEHVAQVTKFQRKQTELHLTYYKFRISKMEAAMQQAQCKIISQDKELGALKSQVTEMKKLLAAAKASPSLIQLQRSSTPRPIAITSPSSRVTPKHTPQSVGSYSGNTASSRPGSAGRLTWNSISRSGGLLTPTGSSITSGRSTPGDTFVGSPSLGSGDSFSYRSASRTPTLLTIPVSSREQNSSPGQLRGETGLPPQSTRHFPLSIYNNTLRLIGLTHSHQASSANDEPRRPIQLNATSRNSIFQRPSVSPSRNAET
ncbi:RING finger protein 212B-like isoform X2 [Scyliorhinus canicula]|uniref:RING finger protein 212B-like isoform X2 n=1 Tax=Scyliorhinus canicula TaxID=7830 RepID=UPI0018F6C5CD|nr:RING finger protein 212B-like isoform X2 [Scyliorhinus canicula]